MYKVQAPAKPAWMAPMKIVLVVILLHWLIGSSKTEDDDETADQDEDEQETAVDSELSMGCSIKHLKSHGVVLPSSMFGGLSK
jgi:hypothetical protein